jgi:hypothetical protein
MTVGLPLDDRIRHALSVTLTSAEISVILNDANRADGDADAAYRAAEERALDPLTPADDLPALRKQMEDARFTRDRLARGVQDLNRRLDAAVDAEKDDEDRRRIAAALHRQEVAAQLLAERYPILAAEIATILKECADADRGAKHLTGKTCHIMVGWSGLNSPMMGVKLPTRERKGVYHWPIQ